MEDNKLALELLHEVKKTSKSKRRYTKNNA